jgi:hypothetical protein
MKETPLLLRFRERQTFWQRLQARIQTFWQRLCTPRIVVKPPLQPARHKPFPKRPHHRRRQAVFAALATAPPEATIHALIAHVRAVTGTGCSCKLTLAWRQEQKSDAAARGQGDAATKTKQATRWRWRAVQLRLFLLCVLVGATLPPLPPVRSVSAQEITISPAPRVSPTISPSQSPISNSSSPRLLRIKLTLQSPHELHIQQGDEVKAGDILSDRRQARARLQVQQRALQSTQRHLAQQRELTNASLQQLQSLGPELPVITFAAERAALQRAETESLAVNRTAEMQRQKLAQVLSFESLVLRDTDTLSSRNAELETRNLITAHETAKLTQAQDQQLLAHSEIALHRAKLTTAREVRAWEEQTHRVEVARQILNVRTQQQQIEIEAARLAAQLAEVHLQLANLTAIRAPFAGTIKRIEWEDMNDETITVLVYLAVAQ